MLRKGAWSDSEQVRALSAIAKKKRKQFGHRGDERVSPPSEWLILWATGMCPTECEVLPDNDGDNLQDGLVQTLAEVDQSTSVGSHPAQHDSYSEHGKPHQSGDRGN